MNTNDAFINEKKTTQRKIMLQVQYKSVMIITSKPSFSVIIFSLALYKRCLKDE